MCAGKKMITTTARFKTFDNILNPKKDTEQGGRRRPSSEIRMNGVVHAVVGGRMGSDVQCHLHLVMKCDFESESSKRTPPAYQAAADAARGRQAWLDDDEAEKKARQREVLEKHLACAPGAGVSKAPAHKLNMMGSLEVRKENNDELYMDSIDILEKVKKVVQGEEQEDLAGTFKVSLRFGDTPEHLTLYVDSDSSQSNVVIQFGREADRDAWEKLKQVLLDLTAVRVAYAENVAEIINTPYKSDLDPWLDLGKDLMNKEKVELEKKEVTKLNQLLKSARCTLNMCAEVHPWAVRGTLHPWTKKKQTTSLPECDHEPECDYDQCKYCKGRGGKDGGLYTGETLLHIVIVQRDHDSAKWLLDRSAMI
jgi:hypothetical protein